ncbi:MAG: bifunctional adenosylcobinamide kinase/adenosylcobinamide-phosphate guanylyltransferase [Pirellulales bacterium]|nr:bifunctional adenosylcobinamide kinase/adenosylcobinamide-phosphate guanylyltransferase [Pirellulales bacterium]
MGRITLVTGGCRSGKSACAQRRAEQAHVQRVYIATCPVIDNEIKDRIKRHQSDRAERNWSTIEATTEVAEALETAGDAAVLIDCLTLWVNNLQYEAKQKNAFLGEDELIGMSSAVLDAARRHAHEVVLVTNEVGSGIVPENTLARHFRDLAGRCNQVFAREADEVVLMVSGIPVSIKSSGANAS